MRSVDIEPMHSVEKEGLRERLELDSRPEFRRRLVAQCSILVVIAGIVAWLIAA